MLTLCGFSASNYYNKVKLALLEKGVPFTEELAWVGETDLSASPLGKVPYVRTPQGALCESAVIADYVEAAYPEPALVPSHPFAAAKVRELITFMELHLELVARNLYPQAFFGGTVSEAAREKIGAQLEKNIAAFGRLAQFSPYVAGDTFTLADWPPCPCATTSRRWPSAPMCSVSMPTARPTLRRCWHARPNAEATHLRTQSGVGRGMAVGYLSRLQRSPLEDTARRPATAFAWALRFAAGCAACREWPRHAVGDAL
jgi:glutathione S-transferase